MRELVFESARDTWVSVLIAFLSIAVLFASVPVLLDPDAGLMDKLTVAGSLLSMGVFAVWPLAQTEYRLTHAGLRVVCGPFRWRIAYESLFSVVPRRSLWSSPALSLDRLELTFGEADGLTAGGKLLISPRQRSAFLSALAQRAPQLYRDGDRLMHRSALGDVPPPRTPAA